MTSYANFYVVIALSYQLLLASVLFCSASQIFRSTV